MSQVTRKELQAIIQSTGKAVALEAGVGCTLVTGVTYIYVLSDADAPWGSVSLKWDGNFKGTIQFEETNLPRYFNDADEETADIADTSLVAGDWIVWPMVAGQVSVIATDATTGGGTYVAATGVLTVAGGTAGGARVNLPDIGSRRGRLKVVATTGGVVRVGHHRKG